MEFKLNMWLVVTILDGTEIYEGKEGLFMVMVVIPALRALRQKSHKFSAKLAT